MASLPLLAGERLLRSLRPSPFAFLPRYAVPALGAAWGLCLLWLFADPAFQAFALGDYGAWYLDPRPVQTLVWALGMGGLASLAWRLFRHYRVPTFVVALSLTGALIALLTVPEHLGAALSWGTLLTSLLATGLVEAHRRSHRYHVTSRRLSLEGGLWDRREVSYRWERLRGFEGVQTPPGRLLKYGTLVPRLEGGVAADPRDPLPALCLYGVRPYEVIQEELLGLIEQAHAPPAPEPAPERARPSASAPTTTVGRIEELLAGGAPLAAEADVNAQATWRGMGAFLHED